MGLLEHSHPGDASKDCPAWSAKYGYAHLPDLMNHFVGPG